MILLAVNCVITDKAASGEIISLSADPCIKCTETACLQGQDSESLTYFLPVNTEVSIAVECKK